MTETLPDDIKKYQYELKSYCETWANYDDDTEKYVTSLGIRMRKTNCFTPECLSPEYLPDEIKKELPNDKFIQSVLNNNDYNIDYCREFMIYTKYLETFQKAPEEALFVYRKLKEYL